jgi:hypothetical protein
LHQRLSFAEGVDRLQLLKLMAEELMLPKVSYRNPVRTFFKVSGVRLLSMPENILRELEDF